MPVGALHYFRIAEGEPLPDIARFAPSRAVIVLGAEYSDAWQNAVSDWLVASGCLYMSAWGPSAATWDDSVDWANIDAFDTEIPEDRFVFTTWHDKESLEETFWFAGFCADHPVVEITSTLILDVCLHDRAIEMLERFRAAQSET